MLLEECVYFPVLKSSQTFLKAFHLNEQITKTLIMLVGEGNSFHCTFCSTNPECISKWFKLQKHSLLAKNPQCFSVLGSWKEQDFLGFFVSFFPGLYLPLALSVFELVNAQPKK